MNILFIHQNFPGQYKHLARHLADRGDRVVFITQTNANQMQGVEKVVYDPDLPNLLNCHPFTIDFDHAVRTGVAVANTTRALLARGFRPDIVLGHNGWGEMLFVKDVLPDTPILSYFEFYYHHENVDVGFDPEFANPDLDPFRLRSRNAVNLLGFDAADWGNTPTHWQRRLHPPELRSRISVLHEGVDTDLLQPDPQAWLRIEPEGIVLNRDSEVITYVARNLEPYRGFHIFMRAAAQILRRRPHARIAIVGGDSVSYGSPLPDGASYRDVLLAELAGQLDLSRVHFLGKITYDKYIRLLQLSSAHVYLTYPFVLSWSFLEAMACACPIVASDTPPVTEVMQDRRNGLLVDFFSATEIADRVDELLDTPGLAARVGKSARQTAVSNFDLRGRQLPLWERLIDDMLQGRRPSLAPEPQGSRSER